jgi:hypothetical protein
MPGCRIKCCNWIASSSLVWIKPKLADTYFNISEAVEQNAPASANIAGIVDTQIKLKWTYSYLC